VLAVGPADGHEGAALAAQFADGAGDVDAAPAWIVARRAAAQFLARQELGQGGGDIERRIERDGEDGRDGHGHSAALVGRGATVDGNSPCVNVVSSLPILISYRSINTFA
jgi:hypothetical protein